VSDQAQTTRAATATAPRIARLEHLGAIVSSAAAATT